MIRSFDLIYLLLRGGNPVVRPLVTLGAVFAVIAASISLSGAGCRGSSKPVAAAAQGPEEISSQYSSDISETANLVAQYVRQWEQNDVWPKPGTYNTNVLIYKGTESGDPMFPGRRRDFYRTHFDGGRELDVILYDDGRIDVKVLRDLEPAASAP